MPKTSLELGMLSGYSVALAFLLVFRTQIAYSRFWGAAGLLSQVSAEWFNAASNLVAFSSPAPDKADEVEKVQHLIIRLFSLLYSTALQSVTAGRKDFEVIANSEVSQKELEFLSTQKFKTEILLQWIQRLIMEKHTSGTFNAPPPILSRVYQELSNGVVHMNQARNITEYPFPFPYAQLLTMLLLIQGICIPIIVGLTMEWAFTAGVISFLVNFSMWCINYIGMEIEDPYGEDPNDLPMKELACNMNFKLALLIQGQVQEPPSFAFKPVLQRKLSMGLLDHHTGDVFASDFVVAREVRKRNSEGADKEPSAPPEEDQIIEMERVATVPFALQSSLARQQIGQPVEPLSLSSDQRQSYLADRSSPGEASANDGEVGAEQQAKNLDAVYVDVLNGRSDGAEGSQRQPVSQAQSANENSGQVPDCFATEVTNNPESSAESDISTGVSSQANNVSSLRERGSKPSPSSGRDCTPNGGSPSAAEMTAIAEYVAL